MAPFGFSRSSFALSSFLAFLVFCLLGGADAFASTTRPIHQQSLPSLFPVPRSGNFHVVRADASSRNDNTPLPAHSRGDDKGESSKLVRGWWKNNPWNKLFLRISLALKKTNGRTVLKQLQKRTVVLSLMMLSIMSYRVGLLPAHAATTYEEPAPVVAVPNEDRGVDTSSLDKSKQNKKSPSVGKTSATVVLAASGAQVFRWNRQQKRQNEEAMSNFESWNASWNATTTEHVEKPNNKNKNKVAVRVNGTTSSRSSSYYPDAEMDLLSTTITNTTWNVMGLVDESCSSCHHEDVVDEDEDDDDDNMMMEPENLMKATVEAMQRAGGESTELVVQSSNVEEAVDEPVKQEDILNNDVVVEEPPAAPVLEKEEDPAVVIDVADNEEKTEDRSKYPKERMPILDPTERAKVQAKYAAIESLEDRAFQILVDLGMILETND